MRSTDSPTLGRAVGRGAWGIADQALISAANFFVMVALARALGPSGFGGFVIAHTMLLFANSIQIALITTPHNLLGPARRNGDYARYTTATALAQIALACAIGLVLAAGGVILQSLGVAVGLLLLALGVVCPLWQLQEFTRRVLYTQLDYRQALLNDAVTYGGQTALIGALIAVDRLTPLFAIGAIGVASAAGTVVGAWQIRKFLTTRLDREALLFAMSDNWRLGKWLLGSTLAYWVSGQVYPFITAGFVGVAAAGGLRGAQSLIAPTHIVLKSMENMLPSQASGALQESGVAGLRARVRRFAFPVGSAMLVYSVIASLIAKPLVELVLGSAYVGYWWLVPIMAVGYMLGFASTVASIVLSSLGNTAPMFWSNVGSGVLTLTLGLWAVNEFGVAGAAAGLMSHGVILTTVLWICVAREAERA